LSWSPINNAIKKTPSLLERFFVCTIFKAELYQDHEIALSWSQKTKKQLSN